MRKTGLAAVSLSVLSCSAISLFGATAMAQPGAQPPGGPAADGSTVIVVQPAPAAAMPAPPPGSQGPQGLQPPPGTPVVVAVAPQNESWNNVSHINGTPVPVGSRNEYLYERRKTVIMVNPVGWLMGFYSGSLSYALSDNIALRGEVSAFDEPGGDDSDGYTELDIGAPLYLRRVYEGPFVEPGLMSRSYRGGDSELGPQVLIGWQVMYDSGWTMAAAMGGGRSIAKLDDEDGDQSLFFNGYFRVGYGF